MQVAWYFFFCAIAMLSVPKYFVNFGEVSFAHLTLPEFKRLQITPNAHYHHGLYSLRYGWSTTWNGQDQDFLQLLCFLPTWQFSRVSVDVQRLPQL